MAEEKKEVNVPDKFKKLVEEVEKMTVLELSELVKVLEEKFGVSASPMVAAAPAAGASDGGEVAAKSAYDVVLKDKGQSAIQVIKVVREVTGLGLKESKDIVDGAPKAVKQGVKKEEAEDIKKKLEAAGAVVELV